MGTEIEITAADGQTFAAYLALPATLPAPGLVVLPEVFNTNDHIRAVVDGYAEDGYVVVAPDIYFREEAGCYLPYTDEGRAKAQALRAAQDTDQYANDLDDTVAALRGRDDCTGKVGVMGFCLGGKYTYLSSVRHPIDAAVGYYGVQIDEHLYEADGLKCPLVLHFAETDPHVPAERLPPFKPAWAIGRMLISTSIPVPNTDLTASATNHIMRRKPRSRGNAPWHILPRT